MMFRLFVLALGVSLSLFAQEDARALLASRALAEIEAIELRSGGVIGVAALDLDSGMRLSYHEATVFPQASVIKIPVLWQLFADVDAGKVDLSRTITMRAADAVGGSGLLQKRLLALGDETIGMTVSELALLMIRDSDNTATNQLIALVGMDRVNALLNEHGFRQTKLQRIMMDGVAAQNDRENVSTPDEMVRIVAGLANEKWLSPASSSEVLRLLGTVKGSVRPALPADAEVASKTGGLPGVYGEAALVRVGERRYAVSIMSTFVDPTAENPVGAVAAAVHRVFERLAKSNRYGHRLQP